MTKLFQTAIGIEGENGGGEEQKRHWQLEGELKRRMCTLDPAQKGAKSTKGGSGAFVGICR
jgi:hypothetical protein